MSFDLQRILESKRAFRKRLASLPLAEKLRMLDALRERSLLLGRSSSSYLLLREVAESWKLSAFLLFKRQG